MNVYYKRLHISERQIGVLAALSPWVNASSGNGLFCSVAVTGSLVTCVFPIMGCNCSAGAAWAAIADYTRWHKPLLILTSVLALLARTSTAFVASFGMICLVALLSETFTAPVSILSDIAIMSAAKTVMYPPGQMQLRTTSKLAIHSPLPACLVHSSACTTGSHRSTLLVQAQHKQAIVKAPKCWLISS